MADILGTTPEFLVDEKRSLILSSEERFVFHADSSEIAINAGLALLDETKRVFDKRGADALSNADKQALFFCMSEVYFDAKGRS
jgi:hypothetical protein